MNVLLLNNTEKYHSGCEAVINFYRNQFRRNNLVFYNKTQNIKDFDVVIANGEGTMHHNAGAADAMLDILIEAKHFNKKTLLLNSVWQDNDSLVDKLNFVDHISVREIKSKNEIQNKIDRPIDVCIDYSYFFYFSNQKNKKYNLAVGNRMNFPNIKPKRPKIQGIGEDCKVDIFSQSWIDIIDILSETKLFVTGRHHELYASCVAECPVIVLEGNSHKNSGLFETAQVNIPCLTMDATNDNILFAIRNVSNYKSEYEKLFYFLKKFPKPNIIEQYLK